MPMLTRLTHLFLSRCAGHDFDRSLSIGYIRILGNKAEYCRVAGENDEDRDDPGHKEEDENKDTSCRVVRQVIKATACQVALWNVFTHSKEWH